MVAANPISHKRRVPAPVGGGCCPDGPRSTGDAHLGFGFEALGLLLPRSLLPLHAWGQEVGPGEDGSEKDDSLEDPESVPYAFPLLPAIDSVPLLLLPHMQLPTAMFLVVVLVLLLLPLSSQKGTVAIQLLRFHHHPQSKATKPSSNPLLFLFSSSTLSLSFSLYLYLYLSLEALMSVSLLCLSCSAQLLMTFFYATCTEPKKAAGRFSHCYVAIAHSLNKNTHHTTHSTRPDRKRSNHRHKE